mgnify:CR=1 FL=1
MTKITIKNNINKIQEPVHKYSNFYKSYHGLIYVLATVDVNKVCLINMEGTRYNDAYEVMCIYSITEKEFSGITHGNKFTKIDSVTITIE